MNTPVSFELAKILKEKGLDKVTTSAYHKNSGELIFTDWDNINSNDDILIPNSFNIEEDSWLISAPIIADVVMWLYEKHGIWIYTVRDYDIPKFNYAIQQPNVYSVLTHTHNDFNSATEAYEAAIEHSLKNLIK